MTATAQNAPAKNMKKIYFSVSILYLLFLSDFMARVGINTIFPVIQQDLGLTDSQVGFLSGIIMIGMAVFVLPISYMADKWSKKKVIILSAFIWSTGTLLSAVAKDFSILAGCRFLVGIGNAAYAAVSVSLISSWFDERRRGKVLGVYDTAMDIGVAIGASACSFLAVSFGWRTTLVVVGIFSLVVTVLSLTIPEDKNVKTVTVKKNNVNLKTTISIIFTNKALLFMCLGAAFTSIFFNGSYNWTPMFMVREAGFSVEAAGSLFGGFALVSAMAYPIGGWILDKWFEKDICCRAWMMVVASLAGVASYLCGFYFRMVPFLLLGIFILNLSCTAPHLATQELVPADRRSVAYGTYVVSIQLAGALGSMVIGAISDAFTLQTACCVIQIFGLFAAISYLFMGKFYKACYAKAKEADQGAV